MHGVAKAPGSLAVFPLLFSAALAVAVPVMAAPADGYPTHPVRIIVPAGAGGPDSVARLLAVQLGTQMGQSCIPPFPRRIWPS